MRDPYQVLGVAPGTSDDEIKKAYRSQCKRYHPDLNPGDATAEEKFKEVQSAYDQIMKQKQGGYDMGGGYQSQQQAWSSGYGPFGGFGYGPFGGFGFGYEQQAGGPRAQTAEEPEMQAARNFINNRRYREALNALSTLPESTRTAKWYYYSALANLGLGNSITAQQHARRAAGMEPNNPEYQRLVDRLSGQSQYYQTQSGAYAQPTMGGIGRLCVAFWLFQLLCNCCFCR